MQWISLKQKKSVTFCILSDMNVKSNAFVELNIERKMHTNNVSVHITDNTGQLWPHANNLGTKFSRTWPHFHLHTRKRRMMSLWNFKKSTLTFRIYLVWNCFTFPFPCAPNVILCHWIWSFFALDLSYQLGLWTVMSTLDKTIFWEPACSPVNEGRGLTTDIRTSGRLSQHTPSCWK